MAMAPGPNTFVTRYPRIASPTFSFFATRRSPSQRDRLGRFRHARGELFERRAEVHRIGSEFLQRLLWSEALVLDDFPLGLVDLAEPVVALEVRREETQNDAVGHDDVRDVLQAAALRLGDGHCFLERG